MLHLLYPCDPFHPQQPDDMFADEYTAARAAGMPTHVFSEETRPDGRLMVRPVLQPGDVVVYRGWMMDVTSYQWLMAAVASEGARMLTSPAQYQLCHHLPQWYPYCSDVTPETRVFDTDADLVAEATALDWPAYFVKDFVKSLTTARGSIARTAQEIPEIVTQLAHYRGQIEGGVCLRRVEAFRSDTEERYFVLRGVAQARQGVVPAVVQQVAARIDSPFFTVDVAQRADGVWRVIELGDGQVSDRKQWPIDTFITMLVKYHE